MPSLANHQSSETTKLLFIGDSGSGKTGALASLAAAGYNLRIADLDNGLDVLSNLLADTRSNYGKEALARVSYQTLTDRRVSVGGRLIPKTATVWPRLVTLLDKWKTETEEFGPLSTWTTKDVLVIDSLTLASAAAMNFVCSMNQRLGQQPHQSDWYAAQNLVESLLQMLYDESIKCNVIISSHITYIGEENGPQHGYPASLGRALSPRIGRYFNSVLMARTTGSGTAIKRKILTNSTNMVELKNTAPTRVKPEYDLATGLADYFRDVRGQAP
jgi:hypothetical protein